MTEPKTMCMVPWLHRFTNEQGLHQLCCSGTGAANMLRDQQDGLSMWTSSLRMPNSSTPPT